MTTIETSTNTILNAIVKPYISCDEELPLYNSTLETNIKKVKELIPTLEDGDEKLAEAWIIKLQNRIQTNNHYVSHQSSQNSNFSVYFCAITRDLPGLRFLLRTGANPNEMKNGKAPIHIAAVKEFVEMAKILKQSPQFDSEITTRSGKTAMQLTTNKEMLQVLQA